MSKLRKTKIRNDVEIRYIFEFLIANGPSKARDIPIPPTLINKTKTGLVRRLITKMQNFGIIVGKKGKDGLMRWDVAFDLKSEKLDEEV